ncbi:MAG: T9SS type A sorting domain-containing protein, partial [Bacteroidia bacterium]|nr:T9SS type A sorting domain-containing protein [Bacteroidia bacterium]NNM15115.1 T9SS type A sorting domain-containing protein [Bacteroidia bacterium]
DRCTGAITLNRNIFPEQLSNFSRFFWEGAYSPNGDIFYVSTTEFVNQDTAYLIQYNLLDTNIALSADTLDAFVNPIGTGAVRLAPDGKVYFSRAYQCNAFPSCAPYPDSVRNVYNENLSVINQPDSLGAACDYQPFSFYLGGKRSYYGLPNNPNYELGPLVGSACDTITSVGLEPSKTNFSFFLYPNPAFNQATLNIQTLKPNKKATLSIFNNIGALLLQKEITLQTQSIDVEDLPAGIYYIQIQTELGSSTEKLIKF